MKTARRNGKNAAMDSTISGLGRWQRPEYLADCEPAPRGSNPLGFQDQATLAGQPPTEDERLALLAQLPEDLRRFAFAVMEYLKHREQQSGSKDDPEATAAHEAGHAVVMAALGHPPVRVGIWNDFHGSSRGAAEFGADDALRTKALDTAHLLKLMMTHAAGFAGERVLTGSQGTAPPELSFCLALAHALGERHRVPAMDVMLGVLGEVTKCVEHNERIARRLMALLLKRGAVEGKSLDRSLRDIVPCDVPGIAALDPSKVDAEVANMLRVAGGFAEQSVIRWRVGLKAEVARSAIASAIDRHQRAALLFSGGKDSMVLAHLAEPFRDRLVLLWVNTQGHLPHMVEHVRKYGETFQLVELASNYAERFIEAGLPSLIVPIERVAAWQSMQFKPDTERPLISDWLSCCAALRWQPVANYLLRNRDITLVIHGQRREDGYAGLANGGCETLLPLWDWSTAEIFEYVRGHGLELPAQYSEGAASSLECGTCCTAKVTPEHRRFLSRHYPRIAEEFGTALSLVYGAVAAEWDKLGPAFDADAAS